MTDPALIPMGDQPGATPPKIRGPIRQNATELAAHLRRKPIAVAAIVVVAGVLATGYVAVDVLSGSGDGAPKPKLDTGHHVPDFRVPKRQPVTAPVASARSQEPSPGGEQAPQQGAAAMQAAAMPAAAYTPPQEAAPTPQETAFAQAMKGGIHAVSWQNGGEAANRAAGTAESSALPPMKVPQIPARDGSGLTSGAGGVYSTHLVRKEVSPYELLQGSVIPATLETGIKSDLSGLVKAVVTHPVYNSLNGSVVLIPAGSTLIGSYAGGAAMGQNRVAAEWTRIEFPNGSYLQLGNHMPGASPAGYAGFRDLVDNHTWMIFKNALLLSLIDVGMAMSSPTSTSTNTTGVTGNQALQNGEQALAQTFGEAEAQMFQKYVNIAPTITIRPGYEFNVIVTRDLVFPGPYVHGATEIGTARTGQPAVPSIANPYPANGGR